MIAKRKETREREAESGFGSKNQEATIFFLLKISKKRGNKKNTKDLKAGNNNNKGVEWGTAKSKRGKSPLRIAKPSGKSRLGGDVLLIKSRLIWFLLLY